LLKLEVYMRSLITILVIVFTVGILAAQDINVTFLGNHSTVPDFTDSTAIIQVRGGIHEVGGDGEWNQDILIWSDQSPAMTHTSGDYWKLVIPFPAAMAGDTVNWKFGATVLDSDGNETDFWESGNNRVFLIPDSDTTLALGFVSNDFDPPYTPSDSIDVWFRVNMSNNPDFNPESSILSIVGALPGPDGADNMWSPGKYKLMPEAVGSSYWVYHFKADSPSVYYPSDGTVDSVQYRFAIGEDWDNTEQIFGHGMFPDNENRGIVIKNDTTVAWKWWNDVAKGKAGTDSVQTKFRVDLTNAITQKGFSLGDTLIVKYGYDQSAKFAQDTLINEIGGNFYSITVMLKDVGQNEPLVYQYYSVFKGDEIREIYFDFDDPEGRSAERRKATISVIYPALLTIDDIQNSQTDARRMPTFRNSSILADNVTVTWTCDLRPAYYQVKLGGSTLTDIQGDIHIGPAQMDSIMTWGVWMNGPAVGDWSNPTGTEWGIDLRNNPEKTMYDDGTNGGDAVAGDSIFSLQRFYSPDSDDVVGQVYKFGIYGGDNEAGGAGFGNNHVANIDDSNPNITIHTQFGSINPPFYSVWDFDEEGVTAIDEETGIVLRNPNLRANYPNPFNPTTTLVFELPKQMKVKLIVYDVLGRQVRTLINGPSKPGIHQVIWNATSDNGVSVSSGVYFYRLTTENYDKTMKMVLMR
jgi:hypothetical protein